MTGAVPAKFAARLWRLRQPAPSNARAGGPFQTEEARACTPTSFSTAPVPCRRCGPKPSPPWKQAALHWEAVTDKDATPRGMTPLLDALGRIVALAETDKPDRAVIVVMTDGMENASREVTRAGAKAALDRVQKRGWDVVFLGANFDNISDAESVGVDRAQQVAMAPGTMNASMTRMAKKSRAYFARAERHVFDEADREAAQESKVKSNS